MTTLQTVKDLVESDSPLSADKARDIIYGMFQCLEKKRNNCRAFDIQEGKAFKLDGTTVTFEPDQIPRRASCRSEVLRNFTDIMKCTVAIAIDLALKCDERSDLPATAQVAIEDGPCLVDIDEYCDIHRVSSKAEFAMKLVTGSMLCVTNFCDVEILDPEDYDDVNALGDVLQPLVYESTWFACKERGMEQQRASKKQKVGA